MTKAARSVLNTARYTLTVFGLSAVAMLALLYTNQGFAKRVSEMLHPQPAVMTGAAVTGAAVAVAPSTPAPTPAVEAVAVNVSHAASHAIASQPATAPTKQQQWVTNWLSKRYRVSSDATNMLVSTAYMTANELKLDPLLILAVMAIESGLNPFAESPMGAKGLMQVMAKVHHDKFAEVGGQEAALNPVANIRVGALILKDYVRRTGSVEGGLKTYVGAADMESDSGYGAKVLAEYRRLKQVAKGHNVPTFTRPTPAPVVASKPAEPEAVKPEAKPAPAAASATDARAPVSESLAGL